MENGNLFADFAGGDAGVIDVLVLALGRRVARAPVPEERRADYLAAVQADLAAAVREEWEDKT